MTRYSIHIVLIFILLFTSANLQARRKDNSKKALTGYAIVLPKPDTLAARPTRFHQLAKPVHEVLTSWNGKNITNCRTGIDVSHYQSDINWDDVVSDEQVGFVYLKATEGSKLVDQKFLTNLSEAKRVGLKVGSYHFFSPTMDPVEQFNNFAALYDAQQQDLIPFIDVEKKGNNSNEQFCDKLDTFLALFVKRYGFKPLIYTPLNFYNNILLGRYNDYKFMIARYKEDDPILRDGRPYILWQYTERGRVKGISGHVDQSRFHDSASLYDIIKR